MKYLSIILGLFCATSVVLAHSNVDAFDPYFQISDVSIEVLESTDSQEDIEIKHVDQNYVQDPRTEIGDVISIAKDLIAFGKEIYKIIEAGKPVINTNYAPISVLPLETKYGQEISPMHLSRWKTPKFVKFKVSYKNGYGTEVVSFVYNVNMSYGGQFGGKGAYITNAQVVPEKVNVLWGYTFNAKMSVVGLSNIGTDEDPIAAATLSLYYSVSTVVREDKNNMTLFIAGDGTIQQM